MHTALNFGFAQNFGGVKMLVFLGKNDLVCLVMGTSPSYEVMSDTMVKENGTYCGGFKDEWQWDKYKLEKLTEEELWQLYNICKGV
jgi:hypothetical protein